MSTRSPLIADLEPVAATLVERHLRSAKEWFPHELVPWSRGRDFVPGEGWSPDESSPPEAVRSSLFVNLLTEDNLPYYSMEIHDTFGADDAWGEWVRRWTAEEGRHSIVIRDWLTVTRAIDPWELERARMIQVSGGVVPDPPSPEQSIVYVTLQELATRLAHHNTGKLLVGEPGGDFGYEIMKRVAADENLHFLFYRDLGTAALERDPSAMVIAMEAAVRTFAMPGVGIPDFDLHARAVAAAGIYDFQIFHDQVLTPVLLRHWQVESLEGLSPEADQAREALLKRIARIGKAAARMRERAARVPTPA